MKLGREKLEKNVLDAVDELRFGEIYLHASYTCASALDRSDDQDAILQLLNDCGNRLKRVMQLLEDGGADCERSG